MISAREECLERGHSERLFPLIEACLAEAGRACRDIGLIAVSTGPGNFTGARIGVAAARGLALSTGARAIGVDRLEALAEGRDGPVCVALNARGGALHIARFVNGALAGAAETLSPAAGADRAAGAAVIGDGASALIAAGGVGRAGGEGEEAALATIAGVALRKARAGDAPRPAPRYLRPVNAAPARDGPPAILP
ncbi:tRNA (adenosine(37)-N6)-threonylcarbamoyltransferase complex dimerization subunit type 1 TsaB [Pikeienuella piscinae]|uniref:tRNA (adenosine(37)-N6)-threonylcarbamoyltransferase complex dimerization subunit type 1 TsaB n=1 Tax=Pikeienuella piscinae TaxID=2748098 RepID=UPI001FEC6B8E|nr:tRNA (adenosine(37)-N6)-threonylcarbamoyltransferase complex dimerization subunit type 1 TsaB [Pikeienuella piscinae]